MYIKFHNFRQYFQQKNIFNLYYNSTKVACYLKMNTLASGLLPYFNIFNFLKGFHQPPQKGDRYWANLSINDLLEEADRLFNEEKYLEVYETLNRIQYSKNVEVQWRISRCLFKLASNNEFTKGIRENMIQEAYEMIVQTLKLNDYHAEVHKWMAILLDAKSGLDGTVARVRVAPDVKYHLLKSLEIHSEDPTVLYLLGYWCYQLNNLTWLQRQIARVIYYDPPDASFEEAYQYFLKAEQIKPRFFIGNIYMLGKCSYDMGMFYRARYYLKIASELPAHDEIERQHSENAKILADKLAEYDVTFSTLNDL